MDILFDEMEKDGAVLDIDRAVNLIFTFFILSQDTTPRIVAATVKLVADNPDVMEELKVFFFVVLLMKLSLLISRTYTCLQSNHFRENTRRWFKTGLIRRQE